MRGEVLVSSTTSAGRLAGDGLLADVRLDADAPTSLAGDLPDLSDAPHGIDGHFG